MECQAVAERLVAKARYYTVARELAGFVWATRILLGALFFLMAMFLTGAAWSVTIRRFSETMAATIPFGILLFIPLIFGIQELYLSLKESESGVEMKDVVIEGEAARHSDAALMLIRRNSRTISDGVSGEMILRESPDLQLTTILSRMPLW